MTHERSNNLQVSQTVTFQIRMYSKQEKSKRISFILVIQAIVITTIVLG